MATAVLEFKLNKQILYQNMDPLFGYDEIETKLQRFFNKPGHIFLLGNKGAGKTSIINNFLRQYFMHHYGTCAKNLHDEADIFFMNSHQDRGIHTVRNVLLDYVRQPTRKPGCVRWIVIDHLESFPELSQQALRRPMELYSHVACFIFIGTSKSNLIPPLLSRCQNITLPDIQIETILPELLKKYKVGPEILPPDTQTWLVSHSGNLIRRFCQYLQLIVDFFSNLKGVRPSDQHAFVLELCSIPSFEIYIPLIKSILGNQTSEVLKNLTRLWIVGESFEDVFATIKKMVDMFGYATLDDGMHIYEFLMKGWVQYSQGYTTYRSLLVTAL
jgi:hypothetical protein